MATPAVILLVMFLLWPIVVAGQYSVTRASGFGDQSFVGLDNYTRGLQDPELLAAIVRNIIFAGVVVAVSVLVGFALSYLLMIGVRGWRPLQIVLMVPYILPVVVTALMWRFILEPNSGLANTVLRGIGLDSLAGPWLTSETTALATVSVVQIWVTVPFAMLLIFGGMVSLPGEVLEAAEIDGAGHLTRMFKVVLPMVWPTIVMVVFVLAIMLFRSFDLVYLLTQGGPINSTTIATLYVFKQGFINNEYGYANALGVIVGLLLVVLAVLPQVWSRLQRRRTERAERRQAAEVESV
ncbi:carbohydrate ABC transporter permease [Microbacterium aquimaris]|uniref:Sugar ABC transporter permease n=1 Tax=Microbacterium aquimaris TaxID=459816 RepID=A0ABU5N7R5_9MICO|nr:sugar ABC transporter permease [Microbacterium aquimaris]MDZ8162060.1 sugar ABC transporter permease [Microbacterium aquimaris]